MRLNDTGNITNQCWLEIPRHFNFVELGEHIVMPNHIDGIIIINNPNPSSVPFVETGHALSLQLSTQLQSPPPSESESPLEIPTKQRHFHFRNQRKNTISAMVGSFRSATTGMVRGTIRIASEFGWQTRFHDHIIRSQNEYIRISNYITNNPANWGTDNFNNDN